MEESDTRSSGGGPFTAAVVDLVRITVSPEGTAFTTPKSNILVGTFAMMRKNETEKKIG